MEGENAVANNGQIVEGIRIGVYQAVSAALSKLENGQENGKRLWLYWKEMRKGFSV